MGVSMNRAKLTNGFTEAVEEMRDTHEELTYYWKLSVDDKQNQWAIVLGWVDGFEPDDKDDCIDGSYRLCVKLAYQPTNSIMKDYDIDWVMPYNTKTKEVCDVEIPIYPGYSPTEIINYLLDCYEELFKEVNCYA
jgi:hypothetical protein